MTTIQPLLALEGGTHASFEPSSGTLWSLLTEALPAQWPQRTPGRAGFRPAPPREAGLGFRGISMNELGFQGGGTGALHKEIALFVKCPGLFWMEV